jgi:hypothetical protein
MKDIAVILVLQAFEWVGIVLVARPSAHNTVLA